MQWWRLYFSGSFKAFLRRHASSNTLHHGTQEYPCNGHYRRAVSPECLAGNDGFKIGEIYLALFGYGFFNLALWSNCGVNSFIAWSTFKLEPR